MSMHSEKIPENMSNEYDLALQALNQDDLGAAIAHGRAALAAAEQAEATPRFFICRCRCLLANTLGRIGQYREAGEQAQEAIFTCSLLPMDEQVFDVWAKSIIYRSAALCGLGDHLSAIAALQAGKRQISGFPGVTALAARVFDDQISLLKQRFGVSVDEI
ncbi:MAG: hypothetical protein K8I00_05875 [Candidatus Omnitrophica bacterium]|nr:hypothetical protein [Candidatus Omnitrophota bacterium]